MDNAIKYFAYGLNILFWLFVLIEYGRG